MEAQIKLGRIFGVRVGLHYSWLIIALLVTLSLVGQFSTVNPKWGPTVIWTTAIITSLLFFTTLLLHELSHAAVARSRGLPVRSITLFALGGVAQIEKEASDAKTEFWMGIVGPITSIVIGALCLTLAWSLGWSPAREPGTPPIAVLQWLGYINIALAFFNMIPGFPLDGGRVLRAIVWWITGDPARSTRIAARVGQVVAFAFIIWGILRFFGGGNFGGLWLTLIGWFLLEAARASYAQVEVAEGLRGVRVSDVMTRDWPVVDGGMNLQTFVNEHLLNTGQRCFVVEENGHVSGLITPHEVKTVERPRWQSSRVSGVMRPLKSLHTVAPQTSVTKALEVMGREDLNQLPVVRDGHLEGIISRSHILRLLQTRAELRP
ncbi:MAG TPA: site-2 protease family protein [Pyrinomonadaceae bacterium]|jgi:Zn-dependent protease